MTDKPDYDRAAPYIMSAPLNWVELGHETQAVSGFSLTVSVASSHLVDLEVELDPESTRYEASKITISGHRGEPITTETLRRISIAQCIATVSPRGLIRHKNRPWPDPHNTPTGNTLEAVGVPLPSSDSNTPPAGLVR